MKTHYFFLLFCSISLIRAQTLANYTSVRNTGISYSSISSTGNSFSSWRNSAGSTQDDNRSDFTNIGFDFWYNGIRYTQFSVSTNGFLDFSSSTDDGGPQGDDFGYNNAAFSTFNSANATRPAIAPFYDDLTAQGNTAALGNSLKYLLTGSAPNRVLTVEWINMAVYNNITPSLNFQVKLYESSGVIEILYGTMNAGVNIFSYSMGLNAATLSLIPTAAQLKELQSVNGNSFSNSVQNNLSTMPTTNSHYVFTPPVPTTVSGSITFSAVAQTSMTVIWPNWASNEIGYVIYNSTDGINYDFVAQTAANASSSGISGLLPATTYYWRVYAVTEGCLSSPLNGTQTTSAAGNKISITTGNWNTAGTWSPSGVPTAADNVTIANGHVVSINVDAQCNNLIVGQGSATTLRFNGGTARTLNVNNNITVNSAAIFNVNTSSNQTHALIVEGDLVNNGSIDFATDANSLVNTSFIKNGNQTLSGSGSNNFNEINVTLSNSADVFEITATNFSASSDFLNLTSGILKMSTTNAVNITPFALATTIPANAAIWLNSANLTMNCNAAVTLYGNITIANGTLNVGNAINEDLVFSGGNITISSGALNVAGNLDGSDINNPCEFNISGGVVTVPTSGSTDTGVAPFHISGGGSIFNFIGGKIIIQSEGGSGAQNLGFTNDGTSVAAVTGGTLQIGNASTPAGQTMYIDTDAEISNLVVNSANATAALNNNSLLVQTNVIISAGTLSAGSFGITLGGNWSNSGTFNAGTGSVTFNSGAAQTISKTGGETFNDLNFTGAGVKTLLSPLTANGNFSITSGSSVDVSTSNFSLTVKKNLTNNGSLNTRTGVVLLNGTTSQSIGGSTITDFYDLTLNNTSGAILTGAENIIGTLSLNNGVFNTNSQLFTMVSTATATARIAQITGSGDITGNVTVQRYMPGGATGWALLGNPVSSALTHNDWDDDVIITCPSCPDGNAAGFTSVYTYDETAGGLYDDPASYVAASSIGNALVAGKGYWLYLGNSQYTTTPITLDVTGTVRKFGYSIPLNYTNSGSAINDGWNLIHNPYPSAISWTALRGSTSNLDNAIYAYNADLNSGTGGFASYVNGVSSPAVVSGGIADEIPMSQGFYVHSTGATVIAAAESNKVATNPAFLRPGNVNANPLLRINLNGPNNFIDETVLYFEQNATDTFDITYDAYKMRGQDPYAPSIALEKNQEVFQINAIAPVSGNYTSDLKTLTGYNGSYTIGVNNINSFPAGACITLYDKYTSATTDLRLSDYVFDLRDTTTASRFSISITLNSLSVSAQVKQPSCQVNNNGRVKVSGSGTGPWNYFWKSNGLTYQTSLNKFTADSIYNLYNGNYDLEVNTVGLCDYSQTSYTINQQLSAHAQFTSVDTVVLGIAPTVQFNNTSLNGDSSYWDFGTSQDFSNVSSPLFTYTNAGQYKVVLIATSATGCKDTVHKFVAVIDVQTGTAIVALAKNQFKVRTMDNNLYLVQAEFEENVFPGVQLSDLQGKLLVDYGSTGNSLLNLKVDLDNYPKGVYFLTLTSDTFKKVIKLTAQ
ncbi:MAG: T9SS type A sorting domain-containing protein [Bacteroidota bacterium]